MKLARVTKLDKRYKLTSQLLMNVILANYDVIIMFPIYGQFGAIRKPGSGCLVFKATFSLKVTYYLTKTENRTKKSLT